MPQKLTKEIVNKRLLPRGITMHGLYVNVETKVKFTFESCEHEVYATPHKIMSGVGCGICDRKHLNQKEINKTLDGFNADVKLIEDYKSSHKKVLFICNKGHEFYDTVCHMMGKAKKKRVKNSYCTKCNNTEKLTTASANKFLSKKGYKLIGEYKSNKGKSRFECDKGHEFTASYSNLRSGNGCYICREENRKSSKKEVNEKLKKLNKPILMISKYISSKSKSLFDCGKGHKWMATPDTVVNGGNCPKCNKLNRTLTSQEVNNKLKKFGITLTGDYIDKRTKTLFKCSKGHIFKALPNDIMYLGGCNICNDYGFKYDRPAILYYLNIKNTNIFKIGITGRGLKRRYHINDRDKFNITKIWEYKKGQDAYDIEQFILKHYKKYKYTGKDILKNGNTELFNKDILGLYDA